MQNAMRAIFSLCLSPLCFLMSFSILHPKAFVVDADASTEPDLNELNIVENMQYNYYIDTDTHRGWRPRITYKILIEPKTVRLKETHEEGKERKNNDCDIICLHNSQ